MSTQQIVKSKRDQAIDKISDLYEGIKDSLNSLFIPPGSEKDLQRVFEKVRELREIAADTTCKLPPNNFCRVIELPSVNQLCLLHIEEDDNNTFKVVIQFDMVVAFFTVSISGFKWKSEAINKMNSYFNDEDAMSYYRKFKELLREGEE